MSDLDTTLWTTTHATDDNRPQIKQAVLIARP